MGNRLGYITVFLAALVLFCGSSYADLITISITAQVGRIDDDSNLFGGQIQVGDTITGFYTYDTDTPDGASTPDAGDYWFYNWPCGISLNVSGFSFKSDPNNTEFYVGIGNDNPWYDPNINQDTFVLRSNNNLPVYNDIYANEIDWTLDDYTGNALSSDALPTTAPVLEDWSGDWGIRIWGGKPGVGSFFIWTYAIAEVELVPEPATILLLGLGAFALRKRKR